ncbi:MAG TPA: MFS transporter [Phototrophicaceae bacterium]|nr:MFS transporter [Phototrophicaceae bacterium]
MPLTTILTLTGIMAVVNLLVPSFTQNPTAGWGMAAASSSLLFMAPYALVGWLVGPFAGRLAPQLGYRRMLQLGLATSLLVLVALATVGLSSPWLLGILVFVLGISYAGVTNVMLNGLGIVLSPKSAPGLLPGLNGASFGIGAGLSFTILGNAVTEGSPVGSASASGYVSALWIAGAILAVTLLVTLALPKPQTPAEDAPAA